VGPRTGLFINLKENVSQKLLLYSHVNKLNPLKLNGNYMYQPSRDSSYQTNGDQWAGTSRADWEMTSAYQIISLKR
jgi:hypothetical protein